MVLLLLLSFFSLLPFLTGSSPSNNLLYSRSPAVQRASQSNLSLSEREEILSGKVVWLHVPKGGTSFWNLIVHYCYFDAFDNFQVPSFKQGCAYWRKVWRKSEAGREREREREGGEREGEGEGEREGEREGRERGEWDERVEGERGEREEWEEREGRGEGEGRDVREEGEREENRERRREDREEREKEQEEIVEEAHEITSLVHELNQKNESTLVLQQLKSGLEERKQKKREEKEKEESRIEKEKEESRIELRKIEERCSPECKGHTPLPFPLHKQGEEIEREEKHFIGMVREPTRRLLSSFYNNRRGVPLRDKPKMDDFVSYTLYPGMKGCQAKMLTGAGCQKTLSKDDDTSLRIANAKKTIEEMAFVGITDRWTESVCLFHAMYGGKENRLDLINSRPGKVTQENRKPEPSKEKEDFSELLKKVSDEMDQKVFEYAEKWFEEQLQIHQKGVRECLEKSVEIERI